MIQICTTTIKIINIDVVNTKLLQTLNILFQNIHKLTCWTFETHVLVNITIILQTRLCFENKVTYITYFQAKEAETLL